MKKIIMLHLIIVYCAIAYGQTYKSTASTTITTSGTSGTSAFLNDNLGTLAHSVSIAVSGSPSALTVTLQGCRFGTNGTANGICDTVAGSAPACPSATLAAGITSTATASGNYCFNANYDYYIPIATWTGGTNVSVTVSLMGNVPSFSAGSGSGGCSVTGATAGSVLYTPGSGCNASSLVKITNGSGGAVLSSSTAGAFPALALSSTGSSYAQTITGSPFGISVETSTGAATNEVGVFSTINSAGSGGIAVEANGGSGAGAIGVSGSSASATGYAFEGTNSAGGADFYATTGGYKFPDSTIQTTAATCNPSLSTFGVVSANGAATGCLSSMDIFADSTFNGGEILQIDAAGVGAFYAQSSGGSQPAAEFNSNSSTVPDAQFDSGGADYPDGSIIFDTTDFGGGNNEFAAMAYDPQDTVCGGNLGGTCTAGTGVTSCTVDQHRSGSSGSNAGVINWGEVTIIIPALGLTRGTLCTLPLVIQSYETTPAFVLNDEADGLTDSAHLQGIQFVCTSLGGDQCTISAALAVPGNTYVINYEFKH
jgi:hypothetical protein